MAIRAMMRTRPRELEPPSDASADMMCTLFLRGHANRDNPVLSVGLGQGRSLLTSSCVCAS